MGKVEVILKRDVDESKLERELKGYTPITELLLRGTEEDALDYASIMGSSDSASLVVVGLPIIDPQIKETGEVIKGSFYRIRSYKPTA